MDVFEIEFGGEIYEIEASDEQSAMNAFARFVGQQSAEAMVPSPIDFGQAPVERENVFGDVTAQAIEQPLEATKFYAGRVVAPERTPLQRAGDVAMTGLAGLGTAYAAGAGTLAEMIAGDTTQERKLARDIMMMGEVAVPELAGVTSGMTRLGRQVAVGKTPLATREIGEMTPTMQAARAAERVGVTPSAAMQGRTASITAAGLEKTPLAAGRMAGEAERVVGEIEGGVKRVIGGIGEATTEVGAGEALQRGAEQFKKTFRDKTEDLYNRVDQFIPSDDVVQAPNTVTLIDNILAPYQSTPTLMPSHFKDLKNYRDALASGQTQYAVLKDLRSRIGEAVGKMKGEYNKFSDSDLKRLYGALSDDMRSVAASKGDDALRAFERANAYKRSGEARIENALKDVMKANTPEQAYNKVKGYILQDSPRASIAALRGLRKSLPLDEFNQVSATIFDKLGKATAGRQGAIGDTFSPSTFLTNWNKVSPSAKKVLTSAAADKGALEELNDLAKIAERAKEVLRDQNVSNTAPVEAIQNTIMVSGLAAVYDPKLLAALVASGVGANLSARAMTSKPLLKAINAAAKKDMGPLQRLAGGEGFIAAEASTILRTLAAQEANQ